MSETRTERPTPVLAADELRRRAAGSYGQGRCRGGTGIEVGTISYDVDRDLDVVVTTHGAAQPGPPGLFGGFPCALNTNVILRDADARRQLDAGDIVIGEAEVGLTGRDVLDGKAVTHLSMGDMLITRNQGGPGFGDPLRRDPMDVQRDAEPVATAVERYGLEGALSGNA